MDTTGIVLSIIMIVSFILNLYLLLNRDKQLDEFLDELDEFFDSEVQDDDRKQELIERLKALK